MARRRFVAWGAWSALGTFGAVSPAEAQYGYGAGVYGGRYNIYNGQFGGGYAGAYRLQRPVSGAQTVTDYGSLINAITSLPGWYGPGGGSGPVHHPRPPAQPNVPRNLLLGDQGRILWPDATPNDPKVNPARQKVEQRVRAVVEEQQKYGHATVRHVVEAKNALTDFERVACKEL